MKLGIVIASVAAILSLSVHAATIGGNAGIKAEITNSGNFDVLAAEGGLALSYLGKEWINWGNHAAWTWLDSSLTGDVNTSASNPLESFILGSDPNSFVITGSFGALTFIQTMTLNSASQLGVTISLTNNSGADITGVVWGVGLDPDVDLSVGGGFATSNLILGQGNLAAVSATGLSAGQTLTLANTTSSSAYDIAAFVNFGSCCNPADPAIALAANQIVGSASNANDSISLAYNIGTIEKGKTAVIGYSYTISAIPEAETYALMLAGLGLLGFTARRRSI